MLVGMMLVPIVLVGMMLVPIMLVGMGWHTSMLDMGMISLPITLVGTRVSTHPVRPNETGQH